MGLGPGSTGVSLRTKFRFKSRDDALQHRPTFGADRARRRNNRKSDSPTHAAGKARSGIDPRISPKPVSQQRLRRTDGSDLHVEFYGPEDGILIVLTHGWGLHGGEWNYLKRELAGDFRLIVWDEPGLGDSTRPTSRDYSINNLARSLEAVLALAGGKPAILLGHSIGGMIILTFCRLFPSALGSRVSGLVLSHTTPYESCPHYIGLRSSTPQSRNQS